MKSLCFWVWLCSANAETSITELIIAHDAEVESHAHGRPHAVGKLTADFIHCRRSDGVAFEPSTQTDSAQIGRGRPHADQD